MNKRQRYIALSSYEQERNKEGKLICLNCGNVLPKRRRKYCKDLCLNEFMTNNNHAWLRSKLITNKENKCDECGKTFPKDNLILDHIIPIALGGDEFNENNLQILCLGCNKIKTKKDYAEISKARRIEKVMSNGQLTL